MQRLIMILVAIALMVIITGFAVFPQRMADFATELDRQPDDIRIAMVVGAVVINLILALVIYREMRGNPVTSDGLVLRAKNAVVEVTLESVQTTLNHQIDKLAHVIEARTQARPQKGQVALQIEVDADEETDLRLLTTQIQREVDKVVTKQMGLKLAGKPLIRYNMGDQFGISAEALEQKSAQIGVLAPTPDFTEDTDNLSLSSDPTEEPIVWSSNTKTDE